MPTSVFFNRNGLIAPALLLLLVGAAWALHAPSRDDGTRRNHSLGGTAELLACGHTIRVSLPPGWERFRPKGPDGVRFFDPTTTSNEGDALRNLWVINLQILEVTQELTLDDFVAMKYVPRTLRVAPRSAGWTTVAGLRAYERVMWLASTTTALHIDVTQREVWWGLEDPDRGADRVCLVGLLMPYEESSDNHTRIASMDTAFDHISAHLEIGQR